MKTKVSSSNSELKTFASQSSSRHIDESITALLEETNKNKIESQVENEEMKENDASEPESSLNLESNETESIPEEEESKKKNSDLKPVNKEKSRKRKRASLDCSTSSENSSLPDLDFSTEADELENNSASPYKIISPFSDLIKSVDDSVKSVSKDALFKKLTYSSLKQSSITIEKKTTESSVIKDKENNDSDLNESRASKRFKKQTELEETEVQNGSGSNSANGQNKSPLKIQTNLNTPKSAKASKSSNKSPCVNTNTPKSSKLIELATLTIESFCQLMPSPKKLFENLAQKSNHSLVSDKSENIIECSFNESSDLEECEVIESVKKDKKTNEMLEISQRVS